MTHAPDQRFLVVNAGSSSLKMRIYHGGDTVFSGVASEIGGHGTLSVAGARTPQDLPDHATALSALLAAAGQSALGLSAAVHRVVHGGPHLSASAVLDPSVLGQIREASSLAPLHNPPALAAIDALAASHPDLVQIGCFDTAFHATIPEVRRRYALPDLPETKGIRRYGFHGISYASLTASLPEKIGAPLPRRLLALHLGNGASLCAIENGRSVATTMGYSPLEGLTMGTRSGDIDGNAVLEIARRGGVDRAYDILNRDSGLKGLAGSSDMRALEEQANDTAAFAIAHFVDRVVAHAGAMVAALGGLDAIAFTGGIGENAPAIRAAIMDRLGFLGLMYDGAANAAAALKLHSDGSKVAAYIHPADEEGGMVDEARKVLLAR